MFGAKPRETLARNPLEGRLLEGGGVEASDFVVRCGDALNDGSFTLLSDASPHGAVVRLDLQDDSYVTAIALDRESNKATIYLLHRAGGDEDEVARKMAAAVFGELG
mgnify:CR=1 FL=1